VPKLLLFANPGQAPPVICPHGQMPPSSNATSGKKLPRSNAPSGQTPPIC